MLIGVPKQQEEGETRCAVVPAAVKKLVAKGLEVWVEAGAGAGSFHADAAFEQAGARVVPPDGDDSIWARADVVVTLHPPSLDQVATLKAGAVLVGMLSPLQHMELVGGLAQGRVTALAMEYIPRISRAQAMDALSSQASLGGYVAVVMAAGACPKVFPMMITAAGTIAPARVLVIGAGVAGLQAIATARRLGAVVEAYDVRAAVKEQVLSLGARFVELDQPSPDAQTAGGYARQQTDEERQRQIDLMADRVIGSDVVISTAAVFGKAPPLLIPAGVVERMRPGAVIVDMAADHRHGRGNCELTQPGQRVVTPNGVTIEGTTNLSALLPVHSSQVYANNLLALLELVLSGEGRVELDLEDPIIQGALLTHEGRVVHPLLQEAIQAGTCP